MGVGDEVAALVRSGLSQEEARMVALRRARAAATSMAGGDARIAVLLALAAAAAVKVPELFGWSDGDRTFDLRNLSLLVLPFVAGYLAWKRRLAPRQWIVLGGGFALASVAINTYPFAARSDTLQLAALHLPVALWLLVGLAHAGAAWSQAQQRMDFVRFSGELFIYFVLFALGGGVLMLVTMALFKAVGIDAERLVEWIVPSGAAGALVIAAWMVESRQGLVENLAPMLTHVFAPLFTVALLVFLATLAWTGHGIDRNALIAFDVLLAVVLGLLLYSISARPPDLPPGAFDGLLLTLVTSALVADGIALAAMLTRISDFGFTPNRIAVLGFNAILLVNLAWSAVLYFRFLRGGPFQPLERWQMAYLPMYLAWAAVVVLVFPPLFGFR